MPLSQLFTFTPAFIRDLINTDGMTPDEVLAVRTHLGEALRAMAVDEAVVRVSGWDDPRLWIPGLFLMALGTIPLAEQFHLLALSSFAGGDG